MIPLSKRMVYTASCPSTSPWIRFQKFIYWFNSLSRISVHKLFFILFTACQTITKATINVQDGVDCPFVVRTLNYKYFRPNVREKVLSKHAPPLLVPVGCCTSMIYYWGFTIRNSHKILKLFSKAVVLTFINRKIKESLWEVGK